MIHIYVLELENNKYYVGKTSSHIFPLEQYNNCSPWTRKYKPLKIIEIIPNCDYFDEDRITLKYMGTYGVNNVRGGTFSNMRLEKEQTYIIYRMIRTSTNKCYICGKCGHSIRECQHKEDNWLILSSTII